MKALSIKQPWASLIAHGIKDIENRTWKTNFRGRVYIHASAKKAGNLPQLLTIWQTSFLACHDSKMPQNVDNMNFSAIIGEVDIVDCVINHESIWAEKMECEQYANQSQWIYNWVLANPILYKNPILNVKGKLSFWEFTNPQCALEANGFSFETGV